MPVAIYHLSAQALSRSSGSSAVAAASYRAGANLLDERTGERHDYSRRSGVDGSEIVAPEGAPGWALDRSRLWNEAERSERRKDSQVAREVRVAIPVELDDRARRELVREFAREQFAGRGMVADVAYHDFAGENPHAHILLTMRRLDEGGFSKRKERSWNAKEALRGWRQAWAQDANRALGRAGIAERIDHRTLAAQREEALDRGDVERAAELDREPQIHLGKAATHMEARTVETERGTRLVEADERNRARRRVRQQSRLLEQLRQQLRQLGAWARRLQALERRLHAAAVRWRPGWDRLARRRPGLARKPAKPIRRYRKFEGPSR